MDSGRGDRVIFALLAFVLSGIFCSWHISTWPVRLRYPGEGDYIEGTPLAEMVHLREGVPIYNRASPERFDTANYGPLYYLLGAQFIDPQKPAYFPLRLLSLVAMIGCAVGCALFAFLLTHNFLAAALAPLVFLSYPIVARYGVSTRCDFVALLLSFVGFLAAYAWRNSRALLLATPLMVVALFYKQQFVAAPLAVLLFLVLGKRYRLAVQFGGIMAVGGLGLFFFFQFIRFRGQAFIDHFLFYNLLPFSFTRFVLGLRLFGVLLLVPVLLGIGFLRRHPQKLVSCYLGSAVLLGVWMVGREGSANNYFVESALIVSSLVAGLFAEKMAEPTNAGGFLLWLAATLVLAQLRPYPPPQRADFDRDRAVQDFLRHNFPPRSLALSYYIGDLVRAGLETPITNLFHYTQLVRMHTLSDRDLLAQLRDHRYSLVVLNFDLMRETDPEVTDAYLSPSLRQAILQCYRLGATLEMPKPERSRAGDRFYAWVPCMGKGALPGPAEPKFTVVPGKDGKRSAWLSNNSGTAVPAARQPGPAAGVVM